MLVDSHAHLNFPDLENNLPETLSTARENEVQEIICVGTTAEDSQRAAEIAKANDMVYAAVGLHPHETGDFLWDRLEKLVEEPKVVAVGECGLDYSRIEDLEPGLQNKEIERQKDLFLKQIQLAATHDLPLIIHVRDAYDDVRQEFGSVLRNLKGVFHCFSGTPEYGQFILENLPGFFCSFAGNITFKNAQNLRDLAKMMPLNRLLIETDAPFLAPEPKRGLGNTPANVKIVAQRLAEVRGVSFEEIAQITTDNARGLFHR